MASLKGNICRKGAKDAKKAGKKPISAFLCVLCAFAADVRLFQAR
jgi:hypothetical protein